MMVTRVSLLLLVTGLFAGMWSADSPDGRSPAQKQIARRSSTPRLIPDRKVNQVAPKVVRLSAATTDTTIPLPPGITAGKYMVVDQSGMTQWLSVSSNSQTKAATENYVPVDQYTVREGERRWHFIRISQPADANSNRPMCRSRAVTQR